MFNTPILFIIFNRPDSTLKVFNEIRKLKPSYLYIAADGPRTEVEREYFLCEQTRNQVIKNIDWECDVKYLLRETNKGCGIGPVEAINWFFEYVEEGIILEDDCLPSPSFFFFCSELLKKYRKEQRIMTISGFNNLGVFENKGAQYFFTKMGGIWGWATWKRAWQKYNFGVPEWKNIELQNVVLQSLRNESDRINMKNHLDKIVNGLSQDFWDYQWWFYRQLYDGLGIVPVKNLIKNIGFGNGATHTLQEDHFFATLDSEEIKFPLVHPSVILRNEYYEELLLKQSESLNSYLPGMRKSTIAMGKLKLRLLSDFINGK